MAKRHGAPTAPSSPPRLRPPQPRLTSGETCPLCGRPLVAGPSVEWHHLVPRSQGGREAVALHRVCHRKIHAELGERDLARHYASIEALRAHPAIADFIRWVAGRPPEFISRTERRRR